MLSSDDIFIYHTFIFDILIFYLHYVNFIRLSKLTLMMRFTPRYVILIEDRKNEDQLFFFIFNCG